FLKVYVFAHLHALSGGDCMGMIWSSDNHRINIFPHFVKHYAVILILFSFWVIVKGTLGIFPVNIAKCYDVLAGHFSKICSTHTTHSYTCNIQHVAWGCVTYTSQNVSGHNSNSRSYSGGSGYEFPS